MVFHVIYDFLKDNVCDPKCIFLGLGIQDRHIKNEKGGREGRLTQLAEATCSESPSSHIERSGKRMRDPTWSIEKKVGLPGILVGFIFKLGSLLQAVLFQEIGF